MEIFRVGKKSVAILGIMIITAVSLFISFYQITPPKVKRINAMKSEFSAERAFEHVAAISKSPHPVGTDEHDKVKGYIIEKLETLGIGTDVQKSQVESHGRKFDLENVIGVINGTDKSETPILLVAHYDTVPYSPGASDDSTGVAALIETARAIKSGPPLFNDIILLFTDGEEYGLLGAKAFIENNSNIISYSGTWVIPIAIVILILFIVLLTIGFRKKEFSVKGILKGSGVFLLNIIISVISVYAITYILKILLKHLEHGARIDCFCNVSFRVGNSCTL